MEEWVNRWYVEEFTYSTTDSIPGLENSHLVSMLEQDIGTSQTRESGAHDSNTQLSTLCRCGAQHVYSLSFFFLVDRFVGVQAVR